jgi:hypothetical protein
MVTKFFSLLNSFLFVFLNDCVKQLRQLNRKNQTLVKLLRNKIHHRRQQREQQQQQQQLHNNHKTQFEASIRMQRHANNHFLSRPQLYQQQQHQQQQQQQRTMLPHNIGPVRCLVRHPTMAILANKYFWVFSNLFS